MLEGDKQRTARAANVQHEPGQQQSKYGQAPSFLYLPMHFFLYSTCPVSHGLTLYVGSNSHLVGYNA